MSINLSKKKYNILIFATVLLAVVSFIYVYFNWHCFLYKPFDNGPQISSPVFFKVADNGDQLYIDQGNYRLIGINKEGKCNWTYINTSACYKELTQAPDGRIFVTNYQYVNDAAISNISIDEFSPSGKFLGSIYSASYPVEHLFDRTSQIMDLQFIDDALTFVTRTDDELLLYSINLNGNNKLQIKASVSWDDKKEHAIKYCYDHAKGNFYVITALGNIYEISANADNVKLLSYEKEKGFNIPYSMTLVDGHLAISDIGSRTVRFYDGQSIQTIATMTKSDDFFNDPALYYSIASASQDEIMLVSSYDTYRLNVNTKTLTPVNTEIAFSAGEHMRIIFAWFCGIFLFLLGLSIVIVFAIYYYKKVGFTDFTYNFMVIIIVVAVSALVIVKYTDVLYNAYQDTSIDKISSIGNLIAKNISAEDVENIVDLEDFNSQSYKNIINFLNHNASNSEDDVFYVDETGLNKKDNLWNADIYLGINKFFDNRIYFILAMPEEAGAIYPLEVAEKHAINLICQNNTLIYPDYVGYFGSYCLVQVPIVSDTNEVVGAVEVGFNKNSFMKEMRAKLIEIIISTAVVLLLSLLLLKEIFFGIKMFFAKKSLAPGQLIDASSVRTPMFLGQTAYHLSVVCGPLFAMQLYNETFGVSKEIAVAIAYSVTLLFVGIFAFVSGVLIKKIPLHKLLVIGTILAIVGELTAATAGDLAQFILGRSVFGSGAGLLLNVLDSMVAMQPDEERVMRGFTMSSAGTNAGTIVGVALGATVIASLGYRWVYVASALILLILLLISVLFYNKNNVPNAMNYVEENSGMSLFQFVWNKRVIGYIFFLTVPYFICMGFIDFFLPLEGKSQGLNVETISYIIIIFGLISIYLGPVLTKKLLSVLDSYIVLIISAVVMSTAIIYYGLIQSVFALVFACVAIAFADSFFQSVQNIYFTQLPESIKYGQGSTLALSNVVIGIAQMGQAYLFAFAMFFGIRKTFLIIGISFLVLTVIFLILNLEDKDYNKIQKNTNYMNH
ncbi:multidrug resistance protein MdtG [Anaerotignum neopropionicum]|uniref:Multidrug resistance protein MdtG n=1 Tax=Anaerotignum neopropionicum TaxID=36847 RepID=A0A136WEK9_9FIRM|nr:MFS transporter [Anaerotignum neopropionicum]KXL52937.1 multidrug resistance protein MdtG [Anaerotignum neopropionicum]